MFLLILSLQTWFRNARSREMRRYRRSARHCGGDEHMVPARAWELAGSTAYSAPPITATNPQLAALIHNVAQMAVHSAQNQTPNTSQTQVVADAVLSDDIQRAEVLEAIEMIEAAESTQANVSQPHEHPDVIQAQDHVSNAVLAVNQADAAVQRAALHRSQLRSQLYQPPNQSGDATQTCHQALAAAETRYQEAAACFRVANGRHQAAQVHLETVKQLVIRNQQ